MEILNIPMAIIHVFFIPMISMMVYYKRKNNELNLNGEFLTRYAIFTAVDITLAKIATSVIFKITTVRLKIDSTYFALITIVISFILPYVYEIIKKNFEITCVIKSNKAGEEK